MRNYPFLRTASSNRIAWLPCFRRMNDRALYSQLTEKHFCFTRSYVDYAIVRNSRRWLISTHKTDGSLHRNIVARSSSRSKNRRVWCPATDCRPSRCSRREKSVRLMRPRHLQQLRYFFTWITRLIRISWHAAHCHGENTGSCSRGGEDHSLAGHA